MKREFFQLSPQDIALINPNTLTCPVFRSRTDAELTKKIYQRVPVLENEKADSNPWGISFMRMFDMSNDSGLFKDEAGDGLVPLYEGKMVQAFDHRAADIIVNPNNKQRSAQPKETELLQYIDPKYLVNPQFWVSKSEVENRLSDTNQKYFIGFKSVTSPTNSRTFIATFLPFCGVGNSMPLMLSNKKKSKTNFLFSW